MSDAVLAIERLRRLRDAHRELRSPDADDSIWFAETISAFLERAPRTGQSLEFFLGIGGVCGRERWWDAERRLERDKAIAAAADRFCSGSAHDLDLALQRYLAAGWLRDRNAKRPPVEYLGTLHADLWTIAALSTNRHGTRVPRAPQIANIMRAARK